MLHTTTGADKTVPLGRVFTNITSKIIHISKLDIRIPPDKCAILNIAIIYHGEELQPILADREPPDKLILLNNTDFSIHPRRKVYDSHKINTGAGYYVPLSMICDYHTIISTTKESPPLVDKIPPDKFTSSYSDLLHLNRRVPPDKSFFIVIDLTSYNSSTIVKDIDFAPSPVMYGENHSLHRLSNTLFPSTE